MASPNVPNVERPSSRIVQLGIRASGVVMGLALAGAGILAVLDKQSLQPRGVLVLLSFWALGFLFVRFGLTGKQTFSSLPRLALFAIAVIYILVGGYTVFFDSTASFAAKAISAIVAVVGGGSLAITAALRRGSS